MSTSVSDPDRLERTVKQPNGAPKVESRRGKDAEEDQADLASAYSAVGPPDRNLPLADTVVVGRDLNLGAANADQAVRTRNAK